MACDCLSSGTESRTLSREAMSKNQGPVCEVSVGVASVDIAAKGDANGVGDGASVDRGDDDKEDGSDAGRRPDEDREAVDDTKNEDDDEDEDADRDDDEDEEDADGDDDEDADGDVDADEDEDLGD